MHSVRRRRWARGRVACRRRRRRALGKRYAAPGAMLTSQPRSSILGWSRLASWIVSELEVSGARVVIARIVIESTVGEQCHETSKWSGRGPRRYGLVGPSPSGEPGVPGGGGTGAKREVSLVRGAPLVLRK